MRTDLSSFSGGHNGSSTVRTCPRDTGSHLNSLKKRPGTTPARYNHTAVGDQYQETPHFCSGENQICGRPGVEQAVWSIQQGGAPRAAHFHFLPILQGKAGKAKRQLDCAGVVTTVLGVLQQLALHESHDDLRSCCLQVVNNSLDVDGALIPDPCDILLKVMSMDRCLRTIVGSIWGPMEEENPVWR